MKFTLTGSLGHISKPLTQILLQQGHSVTVISSKPENQQAIEALGATATIGSVEDVSFLEKAFTGANAVYCMIPPNFREPDQLAYYNRTGNYYAQAIQQAGVQRAVLLSSYGAHLEKGTGFIAGSYLVEKRFDALAETHVTHIRPGYFYYNLLQFTGMIKSIGYIASNYGAEDRLALVSPQDIAAAIAEEIVLPGTKRKIRYVVSDDRSCNEVAGILGKAIGLPHLQWEILSSHQVQSGLEATGMPSSAAAMLTELGAAIHNGILREDYQPQDLVSDITKTEAFAREFAKQYLK